MTAPSGDPISGITVTLNRRIGVTTNPFSGTISNLSGTTDSDGLLTYTLAPGDVVSGSTATIPMGGPTIPNNSATQVGTTCTYRYQLCHVTNVTTTMDGTAVRSRA